MNKYVSLADSSPDGMDGQAEAPEENMAFPETPIQWPSPQRRPVCRSPGEGDGHRRMPSEWVRQAQCSGPQALSNLLVPKLGLQLSVSEPGLPGHGGESYGL